MARPRVISKIVIEWDFIGNNGLQKRGRRYLDIKYNDNKNGTKFFLELPKLDFLKNAFNVFKIDLQQKSYARDVEWSKSGDNIEFYLSSGIDWNNDNIQDKIQELLQNDINESQSRKSAISQTTTTTTLPQTAAPTSNMPQSMSDIRVETIINQTQWSQGLKDSMLEDFKRSGYFKFANLVEDDVPKTAQKIERKIDGFASGKNTYLQAKMLADLLFKYAKDNSIPQYPWSASPSTQPSSDKIYGIWVNSGVYSGTVIEIESVEERDVIEEKCVFGGRAGGIMGKFERTDFIVAGDGITKKNWSDNFEVLEITEKEIKLKNLSDDSVLTSPIAVNDFKKIKHNYYSLLSDKFPDPQASTQPSAPSQQPSAIPPPNSGDKIYGVVIKGALVGDKIEVKGIYTNAKDEKDIMYDCVSLDDSIIRLRRDYFIVEGDILNLQDVTSFKILKIEPNTEYILADDLLFDQHKEILIKELNFLGNKLEIEEYYKLSELFESKKMAQSSATQVTSKAKSKTLTEDEKEIEKLKKNIADLIFLKGTFSPIEFEGKMKVGQKIDEVQKKINEINIVIVDKKLKGNKIFDDLFEQSFTPIKNNYEVYVESETENTDFFAPNGEKSELKNSLNSIIRTNEFKEWFGDWQLAYAYRDIEDSGVECSKILNNNHEPLIVWHGTGTQFSYFRFDNFPAAYFAVNKKYSEWFANLQSGGEEGYTMPFFLNLRNPLDLTKFKTTKIKPQVFIDYMFVMTGMTPEELEMNPIFLDPNMEELETWVYLRNNPKMLKKLADSHIHDGIHFYETNPSVPEGEAAHVTEAYITFKPESCKIADPDRGDLILASMKSFLLAKGGKI